MEKIIGSFQSANHSSTVTYFQFLPSEVVGGKPPKAVVQLIHGMCEYTERYTQWISFLLQQGIVVCGADHIGHGRSVSSDYDLGYFGEKDGDLVLAQDAWHLLKMMQQQYPQTPYFCFGHSMGSFVLRDLLARFSPQISGAILCGTAGPNQPFGAGKLCIKLVRKAKGSRYRSPLLNQLMFGSYNKRIAASKTQSDWISRDEAVVEAYRADPKCNFIFTAAAMEDLLSLLSRISKPDWANKVPKQLPLYLVAGAADPVGSYGKGVTEVYHRLQQAGVEDVSCKLYPEDRHELLNELDRETVMEDLLGWMQAHGMEA